MNRKLSSEEKQRVVQLYKEDKLNNWKIAGACDISIKTLYRILDEFHVSRKNNKRDESVDESAVKMYIDSYKLEDIYERTGISCVRLYKALDERKIPRRNETGERVKKEKMDTFDLPESDKILDKYIGGSTRTQIAKEFGISFEIVTEVVNKAIEAGIADKAESEVIKDKQREKTKKIAMVIHEIGDDKIVIRDVARVFHVKEANLYFHLKKLEKE